MDSGGSQTLLFQDCFPLLGSSLTKWDCVSATNENITFKPGSDQSGKQEWALYSATQLAFRYHPTGAQTKLEKSSPVVWKEPPKAKKTPETFASAAQLLHRVGFGHAWATFFQLQLILLFLSSIREFSIQAGGQHILFSQAPAAGICRKPGNALWLLQAARPGGLILPQKCRAAELPAALKAKQSTGSTGITNKLYFMHICLQQDDLGTWIHLLSETECWHSKQQTKTRKSPQNTSSAQLDLSSII